ncbi:MAG: hypothetical protein GX613_04610 [Chloroflexi bacterium]|nr:hypothetical protein [Chloroflexota bacterium]
MAKKRRNPNVSQETLARARRELYGTTGPIAPQREPSPDSAAAPNAPRRIAVDQTDLHAQYAYVIHDLRNMGVLAGIFMTVLVILSFVI